ncbi:MAG: Hsp20/alpha crystallin family protein [Candidatus Paceibacterota bacterium]
MFGKNNSIFNKIAGSIKFDEEFDYDDDVSQEKQKSLRIEHVDDEVSAVGEEEEEGQLTVDVYDTPTEIVVQSMVAGVRPEDLSVSITRDSVTINGRREENKTVNDENYFIKELYWGSFSRTIALPHEVDVDNSEAIERHGLLVLRLPKLDKSRKTTVKVKSI